MGFKWQLAYDVKKIRFEEEHDYETRYYFKFFFSVFSKI